MQRQLLCGQLPVGGGVAHGDAHGGDADHLAIGGGQRPDRGVGAGLDGHGVGLPALAAAIVNGEVEVVALLIRLTGGKVGHHVQMGGGAGGLVHVELDIDAAALLEVRRAQVHTGLQRQAVHLAVAGVLVGYAFGIVHGVGQNAAAALVDKERLQCDSGAAYGELGVQLGQVIAHQTLHGIPVTRDALHVRQSDELTGVALHRGGGGVHIIGKGVVGGVVHLVGGGYVGSDERHHAGGRGHRQRQRGGNGDDRALAQGAMGLFIVLHGPLNLHQCVGGGVQGGEGLLEKLVFRHVCGTSDKMCFSFSLARASRVRTVSSGTSSRPAISFWR